MRLGWLAFLGLFVALSAPARAGEFSYSETLYAELDPARIRSPHDERLVLSLFEALTTLDPETGEPVPGVAERWEVDPDGRVWTFHLRKDAIWNDGKSVRAADFVGAWRRALDPYEPSRWAVAFRVIEGCADLADDTAALSAASLIRSKLRVMVSADGEAKVPGGQTRALLARSGMARYADRIENETVKAFALSGGKDLTSEEAGELLGALKTERRRLKKVANRAFDAFGRSKGVVAKDDTTLEIRVSRPCPWLPELVARGPFVPLTAEAIKRGEAAFLPGDLVSNGPFALKGRGAKPHAGVPNPLSVVHLVPSPRYVGPRKARSDAVFCFTGQGAEEDLRRQRAGELQWLPNPATRLSKQIEAQKGFQVHPGSGVVLLRFRCDRPPFDSLEVRRAFVDALRDAKLASACWPQADDAHRLVPPSVMRSSGDGQARRGGAKAKAALKAAKLAGEAFPWIELRYVERGAEENLADRVVAALESKAGVELGLRIESVDEMAASVRAGAYEVALDRIDGLVNDPEAFVLPFSNEEADGGTGWEDALFESLVQGARDPGALVAKGCDALGDLESVAGIRAKVEAAAGGGGAKAMDALRRALLEAAETRLLEAYVVVPLVFPKRAFVLEGAQGVGGAAAWKNPAFVGTLWSAR